VSTSTGKTAEAAAVAYLQSKGFAVLEQNWRTRFCEIDIVAKQKDVIHFVEVKYRQHSRQGSGLEYITPKKLQQMRFAAEMWVSSHEWLGAYTLSAIEVSGDDFTVGSFIPDVF
jgi:uncharacterized protein (TIGR00252 family)